jgi:hypothetical protein
MQKFEAIYNGTDLQLEEPLDLAKGTRVRILVESIMPSHTMHNDIGSREVKRPRAFMQMAQSLKLQGNSDWSEKTCSRYCNQDL